MSACAPSYSIKTVARFDIREEAIEPRAAKYCDTSEGGRWLATLVGTIYDFH